MPDELEPALSPLEATYKTRDVEGILDLYFYRRVAFRLAQFFARINFTPVGVTVLGGILGIVAGHLYFYRDVLTNIVGMILHVSANMLDNADGQLARLLNQKSRIGRVTDSFFDHLIFLSIYVHLALRCLFAGASPAVLLLAAGAAISHALQGAAADYFRNGYLYFVKGRAGAEWDSTATLLDEYRKLRWKNNAWHKFLVLIYLNFTRQQELLSPQLKRVRALVEHDFGGVPPLSFRQLYRKHARPMLRWWGFLMTNTRMFFLFLFLILDLPAWYFWLEVSAFNLLLLGLLWHQETMSRLLARQGAVAAAS